MRVIYYVCFIFCFNTDISLENISISEEQNFVHPPMATITTVSSSWGREGWGDFKVSAEVNCQADPRLEESLAVWPRDGGSSRGFCAIFPCLPALLCCIRPTGFKSLGALVDRGSPPTSVVCSRFPKSHGRW